MSAPLTKNDARKAIKQSGNNVYVKKAMQLVSPSTGNSGLSMSSIFGTGTSTKKNISKEKHWLVALLE